MRDQTIYCIQCVLSVSLPRRKKDIFGGGGDAMPR